MAQRHNTPETGAQYIRHSLVIDNSNEIIKPIKLMNYNNTSAQPHSGLCAIVNQQNSIKKSVQGYQRISMIENSVDVISEHKSEYQVQLIRTNEEKKELLDKVNSTFNEGYINF